MFRRLLRSRRALVVAGGIVLAVLALGSAVLLLKPEATVAYSDSDPAYNRAYWTQVIEAKGAKVAFEEFRQRNEAAPDDRRHFSAHVFGGVVAEKLGPAGVTVCDASFGFGCYHGLFGEIISTGGSARVKELDAACMEAYGPWGTGCQHGIGHGILEYVGTQKLAEALELCKETSQPTALLGCTTGVFMEYDFPLSEGKTGTTNRPFDPAKPYAPCDTVKEEFKDACYVELGQWYRYTFTADAEKIGGYCAGLPERARTHCFLGIGSTQGSFAKYDPAKAVEICSAFAPEDELRCRAGVWWSFYQVTEERAKGAEICTYADPKKTAACLKMGDFTGGMAKAR